MTSTVEFTSDWLAAVMFRSVLAINELPETYAFVSFRMTFVAFAPAPLRATPTAPPPMAAEAAAVRDRIVDESRASIEIAPTVDRTDVPTSRIEALTSLSISLNAIATPIEIAAPTAPNPADNDAAPVFASITDVSRA